MEFEQKIEINIFDFFKCGIELTFENTDDIEGLNKNYYELTTFGLCNKEIILGQLSSGDDLRSHRRLRSRGKVLRGAARNAASSPNARPAQDCGVGRRAEKHHKRSSGASRKSGGVSGGGHKNRNEGAQVEKTA
ncbi:MAG: hypothetical protein LBK56_09895 [Gracilibacteraceae bacterium]|nr:hypothetical protein [Gracilibacteraceae bacterium]